MGQPPTTQKERRMEPTVRPFSPCKEWSGDIGTDSQFYKLSSHVTIFFGAHDGVQDQENTLGNVPRFFPLFEGGDWERDYYWGCDEYFIHVIM